MHVRFFTITVHGRHEAADELNRFLAAQRVIAIDRELIHDGTGSVWAVSVTVVQAESRPRILKKIDYKDVLTEANFAIYAKLRSLHKTLADQEGVQSYALFTNKQLAEIVQGRVNTAGGLREIHGIGDGRVKKYGDVFLDIMRVEITSGRNRNKPDNRNDNLGFRCVQAHEITGGSVAEQTRLPAIACLVAQPKAADVVVGNAGACPNPHRLADRRRRSLSVVPCQ